MRAFCETFRLRLKLDKFKEIIALTSDQLKYVKKQYKYIGTSYAGSSTELQNKIDELKLTIKDNANTHLIEIKDKDLIIKDEVHRSEILTMKLEINALVTENTNLKLKEYNVKFGNL